MQCNVSLAINRVNHYIKQTGIFFLLDYILLLTSSCVDQSDGLRVSHHHHRHHRHTKTESVLISCVYSLFNSPQLKNDYDDVVA